MIKLASTSTIIAAAGIFAVAPATASRMSESSATAPAAQNIEVAEAEDEWVPTSATRIVCRRLAQHVGSRIGTRNICATAQQWDRWRQENRDVLENAGTRSRIGGY